MAKNVKSKDSISNGEKPKPRTHLFGPGNNANPAGRPKGSRNKLSEAFVKDLLEDWQVGGKAAIQMVRIKHPDTYVRTVLGIMPKEFNLNAKDETALDQLLEQFSGAELDNLLVALASLGAEQKGQAEEAEGKLRAKPNSLH